MAKEAELKLLFTELPDLLREMSQLERVALPTIPVQYGEPGLSRAERRALVPVASVKEVQLGTPLLQGASAALYFVRCLPDAELFISAKTDRYDVRAWRRNFRDAREEMPNILAEGNVAEDDVV